MHQVTGVAGRHDAVTSQMREYYLLLAGWENAPEIVGGMHAAFLGPRPPSDIEPLDQLVPGPDDLLLIHYSGWVPGLARLLELPQRKLLVYHNVTPARYFWRVAPVVALTCELGRERLPALVSAADLCAAVSSYNADELREAGASDPRVVPILCDPLRLVSDRRLSASSPLVLAVGRLAPHKRPDLVIRAFALYQQRHAPDARLMCVGPALDPAYLGRLERLVDEVGARNVSLGPLSDGDLATAYSSASVFLSLSEHEGFCIPLLEAFHKGLPVVARPAGGMPEVGGDAPLWVEDGDLSVTAELLHLATTDRDLRTELVIRGRARADHFAPGRVADQVRALIGTALRAASG